MKTVVALTVLLAGMVAAYAADETVTGNLTVTGNSDVEGDLFIGGYTTLDSQLDILGNTIGFGSMYAVPSSPALEISYWETEWEGDFDTAFLKFTTSRESVHWSWGSSTTELMYLDETGLHLTAPGMLTSTSVLTVGDADGRYVQLRPSEGNLIVIGDDAGAIGLGPVAIGVAAHSVEYGVAIGAFSDAYAAGSTALGSGAKAYGNSSVALGSTAQASGPLAVALGMGAQADGTESIALGRASAGTLAEYGIAIGDATTSSTNIASVAIGRGAVSNVASQVVVGSFNVLDTAGPSAVPEDSIFVVGNGTDNLTRSNAFVVKRNGDTVVTGGLETAGETSFAGEVTVSDSLKISSGAKLLVAPQGDIDMGEFTNGEKPPGVP